MIHLMPVKCTRCDGSGAVACTKCDGRGRMDHPAGYGEATCDTCDGDREIPCPKCNGEGEVEGTGSLASRQGS